RCREAACPRGSEWARECTRPPGGFFCMLPAWTAAWTMSGSTKYRGRPVLPVNSPMRLETSKPVAYDSPDHLGPVGTANDNTTNPRFNRKLFAYLPDVRLLDIGCAGGGLVKSIIDDGGFAVGIEGSDYSKQRRRAEWATIPDRLFTADAAGAFRPLVGSG